LINYLGNYTHRVAIANERIIDHTGGKVSFWYKDYKSAGSRKKMTLDQDEFIRRFLQHVLPLRFSKIRYYGFMSLRKLQENVIQCSTLLNQENILPKLEGLSAYEVFRMLTNKDPHICSTCKKGSFIAIPVKTRDPD
jgi:hypothetical protein